MSICQHMRLGFLGCRGNNSKRHLRRRRTLATSRRITSKGGREGEGTGSSHADAGFLQRGAMAVSSKTDFPNFAWFRLGWPCPWVSFGGRTSPSRNPPPWWRNSLSLRCLCAVSAVSVLSLRCLCGMASALEFHTIAAPGLALTSHVALSRPDAPAWRVRWRVCSFN